MQRCKVNYNLSGRTLFINQINLKEKKNKFFRSRRLQLIKLKFTKVSSIICMLKLIETNKNEKKSYLIELNIMVYCIYVIPLK